MRESLVGPTRFPLLKQLCLLNTGFVQICDAICSSYIVLAFIASAFTCPASTFSSSAFLAFAIFAIVLLFGDQRAFQDCREVLWQLEPKFLAVVAGTPAGGQAEVAACLLLRSGGICVHI